MFESYNDLITVKEMQTLLGISKNTAYNLIHKDKIKCFRIGRRWRIPRQAIEEYVYSESSAQKDQSSI